MITSLEFHKFREVLGEMELDNQEKPSNQYWMTQS